MSIKLLALYLNNNCYSISRKRIARDPIYTLIPGKLCRQSIVFLCLLRKIKQNNEQVMGVCQLDVNFALLIRYVFSWFEATLDRSRVPASQSNLLETLNDAVTVIYWTMYRICSN